MDPRHGLSDAKWNKIRKILARKAQGRPSSLGDRLFVDAVIWRARTGASWRDLHPRFGNWKTVFNRFREWSKRGIWRDIVREVVSLKKELHSLIDSSSIRAHQNSCGGAGGQKKTPLVDRKADAQLRSMLWSIMPEDREE
jgi:transposase